MEQEERPKLIGLTGGIGSGKTSAARILEEAGFAVYFSDLRAKELVNECSSLKSEIKILLGEKAYDESGFYDTRYVAKKVFSDDKLLQKLNLLIHPAVRRDFELWKATQNGQLIFKETALLFELGLEKQCDKTLLVTAEDNVRLKRVMDRDGKTYREVEHILDKQMPEKDKIKKADYVIFNNGCLAELKIETRKILEIILEDLDY